MKYIYPAIFTPEPDGISVDFPDLPGCYTDGATVEEAFENAEDALSLMLWLLEKEKQTPPTPTPPTALRAAHGASIALVKADTLPVRKLNDSRTVRKNITLPGWMDTLAKEHHINFSQLLQNAIRKECGIEG
ncbi:MAG: type II toxin-antitoxin system HicB family antitoxin [Schwartzia sp. (in: firmicutes)]